MGRVAQLRRDWSRGGWAGVLRRLSLSIRPTASELVILARHPPLLPADSEPRGVDDVELRFAGDSEVEQLAACAGHDPRQRARLAELYRGFFASGARCLSARRNGRVIGHLWAFTGEYTITVDDYRHTRIPVALDAHSVFTGNGYVVHELRNSGVFRQLKLRLIQAYPAGTSFYTWVDRRNDASLQVNRAVGYTPIAQVRIRDLDAPALRLEGNRLIGVKS
jgi:hypothetical protein